MRLVFMGTPDFAVPALAALMGAGHEIACVYSQPPRPAGRGHKARPGPVHAYAQEHGLAVRTPRSLRDDAAQADFAALEADAAVVAAYGLILPGPVLAAPKLGCVNIHASLLPRWRGAAPIQRAILAGDAQTGITIMQMDTGLDTGPMLLREAVEITPATTAQGLHDVLAGLGGRMIVEALDGLAAGTVQPVAQPEDGVTYAAKIDKDEGRLDWRRPAAELARMVRAFTPWPGAWFEHDGRRIKVLEAAPEDDAASAGEPGTVLDDTLRIACGRGALRLCTVQRAGKAPMAAQAFLRGFSLAPGTVLPCPATS